MTRAMRTALRLHEISGASPYRISFAAKGKSGASFGFTQGDLYAGPQYVKDAFTEALDLAGAAEKSAQYLAALARPLSGNPLSAADTAAVNAALNATTGRPVVDRMDEQLFGKVLANVDKCVTTAVAAGREVKALARIYMAMWSNMTGPPTDLLIWLQGGAITLRKPVPPAAAVVDGPAMEGYLAATDYFVEHPENWPQMLQSAAAGAQLLNA